MNAKRMLRSIAASILAVLLLCPAASAAAPAKSSAVIATALAEVGYTEGAREYSKYGEWYGLPHSYWCDMFVSWCANAAGIPASKFPRQCTCTVHVNLFSKKGLYQSSASRGGSYIPRQGDAIFFYNYIRYPSGSAKNHTGLVLYVEDGYVYTIEGNALANRLDLPYGEVSPLRDDSQEPPDYVTVNRYPLNAPHIHGYATPAYDDRTPLELTGFVDLGRHKERAAVFQAVAESGVMSATSSHTFSPNHGMTRGEFVALVTDLFGLQGCAPTTADFEDVPPESAYYAAVMSARSAGLINGAEENRFLPDSYVSAAAAQAILSRAQAYCGMEAREFTFTPGDYSYIHSSYTIRSDIAQALYELCQLMPLSKQFAGAITLDGSVLDWSARQLDGVCYVPAASLHQTFPALELDGAELEPEPEAGDEDTAGEDADMEETQEEAAENTAEKTPEKPAEETPEEASEPVLLPVPMGATDRVLPGKVTLRNGETTVDAAGFTHQGTQYVSLADAAKLLSLEVAPDSENGGIILTAH